MAHDGEADSGTADRAGETGEWIPVGRVMGHRGCRGELTVRVGGGAAEEWASVSRVWICKVGKEGDDGRYFEVEHGRAYRDRLVLKLRGVDDGNTAEGLRGRLVAVAHADASVLEDGTYYRAQLVGLEALDENGTVLGRVEDLVPTAGHDLLCIKTSSTTAGESDELLVPWVPEAIVLGVDLDAGQVRLRLPEGLRELNRE